MNTWISLEDEKPPFGKQVLVHCAIYGRYIGSYEKVGDFAGAEYGNWHDGKSLGVLPPTHWMELPEPPKI